MTSKQLELLEKAVRNHIVKALVFLHKSANVGDNHLELGKYCIEYSDGADFDITSLHWDTTQEPTERLRFYQEEQNHGEVLNLPVTNLETDKLIELLASLEAITGCKYDKPFIVPKALKRFEQLPKTAIKHEKEKARKR